LLLFCFFVFSNFAFFVVDSQKSKLLVFVLFSILSLTTIEIFSTPFPQNQKFVSPCFGLKSVKRGITNRQPLDILWIVIAVFSMGYAKA